MKVIETNVKKEEVKIKHEKSGFLPAAPLFSSSGLIGLTAGMHPNSKEEHNSSLNPFMPLKNNLANLGMMNSSVIGAPNAYDIKDEDDCNELMVGLQDGQS